ncbi:hypothetical protein [Micromonospora sp. NPDC048830]|uniref:hypothetical protein n=1 Tax=Micromonospora sp. NPDC048830 TaxID=3364257 RepID=UPI00371820EE
MDGFEVARDPVAEFVTCRCGSSVLAGLSWMIVLLVGFSLSRPQDGFADVDAVAPVGASSGADDAGGQGGVSQGQSGDECA